MKLEADGRNIDVANQSSTSESLETPFITSFGDKSEYNGTFYKDTVNIGGDTLENVQFGVTTKTAHLVQDDRGFTAIGLIGVGFESNEATKYSEDYTYPNIISDLYNNELIGAKAFSLYLNGKGTPILGKPQLSSQLTICRRSDRKYFVRRRRYLVIHWTPYQHPYDRQTGRLRRHRIRS